MDAEMIKIMALTEILTKLERIESKMERLEQKQEALGLWIQQFNQLLIANLKARADAPLSNSESPLSAPESKGLDG